jgi:HD-like signal output (HDOD) protein
MHDMNQLGNRNEPLPLDTAAAVQLLDLFRDPDHDLDRIVEFISQDPGLAAETVRRCNNAAFGSGERVTDVFEAVNRLGYYELYAVVEASLGSHARAAKSREGAGKAKGGARADFERS